MAEFVLTMPDVGEGVAEAELVEWNVKPGDLVHEDMVLAAVMTDKATVEIPSPVAGVVTWLAVTVGNTVPVKAPLLRIETDVAAVAPNGSMPEAEAPAQITEAPADMTDTPPPVETQPTARQTEEGPPAPAAELHHKPLASPAVRQRADDLDIDLAQVKGTGPDGHITHADLDGFLTVRGRPERPEPIAPHDSAVEEVKLTGLRRKIAEKMVLSASRIPHITYVEEVDVTDLEDLRATMNGNRRSGQAKLTILPFLMRALVKAVADHPGMNATFDDEKGVVSHYEAVHIGIATQTPSGLTVPVVRHTETLGLWECAEEVARVAEAARTGTAHREELIGSTITISSLGALGGVVSTPIINHPEVAIIGVNKIMTRPVWDGIRFVPRKMMNLSSSFDHRVVDGWDAAVFIQALKALLEKPALIFIE
ncbi:MULTISPECIES: dihydrolipoamide acetyltransferase family protein [Agrobacterium tumefaciens complex]|jgi:2-oxoisovalerate dehydrogenase E2 component (dihydrolipoyl transacylase)|uniref:dihydrolipoamide acetyltransferase family protein n=1 Tax=Agrobacterium tumefaciens complex TaxID=1183400 RepID=UPI000DD374C3|nr:dihydrolipoamide acetyltransferase family protein [Agrobacterium tumefaciens]UXS11332.1 2-oxo acid dehydrogenase subunit E2 [Agrobacterium tumefaciens]UXS18696.1 2-oxo acid dehydrogenase subunit E2 [Agrobacterium tumefaciens]UXT67337.1 2-oxo acid dehydrogenase subunit E2 [Agrobacterium tumefaciens]